MDTVRPVTAQAWRPERRGVAKRDASTDMTAVAERSTTESANQSDLAASTVQRTVCSVLVVECAYIAQSLGERRIP